MSLNMPMINFIFGITWDDARDLCCVYRIYWTE